MPPTSTDTQGAPPPEGDGSEVGKEVDFQGETDGSDGSFFISKEHLGSLNPASVKPGDVLEFKVVGLDASGDLEVAYSEPGKDGAGMDKMKNDLASHMSAGPEGEM